MIQIKIPFKTPSVNILYTRNRFGNQCKSAEANKLKKIMTKLVEDLHINIEDLIDQKLKVITEVHENWFTKKGTIKKVDVMNREKFQDDVVFEALGLDDKSIFDYQILKIQDTEEYSIIKISKLKEEELKNAIP